jgi:ABC-2 type transport system ATP-binding protein
MSAILIKKLGRVYQTTGKAAEIQALSGVTLDIEAGEVRGLLGPNGAGKTTLVKILSTVLLPTEGSATIFGYDVVRDAAKVRPHIGIVFGGDRGLHWQLTARETLEYWAALYAVPVRETPSRISALLERVGLAERADTRVETFSRGMKQRLHLARGLVGNAKVLFLDEPTIGMDPVAARDFRELVRELKREGRTILLTTHDMAEAEAVCDRVALIDRGRLIATETPASLSLLVSRHERVDFAAGDFSLVNRARSLPGVLSVTARPLEGTHRIELADGSALKPVLNFLVSSGVTTIRTSHPSLEEVYVHLIGDRGMGIEKAEKNSPA